jgi:glycosyltransferase involved in cell wall biosynthesis
MISTVTIVQRILPHYRIPFFAELRSCLESREIGLNLIYGQPAIDESMGSNELDNNWARKIKNLYLPFGMVYQPCFNTLKTSELVIVEQASRYLLNFLLMIKKNFINQKIGFWGHGINFQIDHYGLKNELKKKYSRKVDWWFAYTNKTKKILLESGVPDNKVSVVQNAIDTEYLIRMKENITPEEIEQLKNEFNLHSCRTGIFCGKMYRGKKIEFLLKACKKIKKELPNFQMLFLGDGPDAFSVKEAANKYSWIHYVGPTYGRDKVKFFLASDVCLYPGIIGLGILETFALETPIITTYQNQSPEIEYLIPDVNGLMTSESIDEFAAAGIYVLSHESLRTNLQHGCRESGKNYTIQNMVQNFALGITSCLEKFPNENITSS